MTHDEILSKSKTILAQMHESFVMATVSPQGMPHLFYMGGAIMEEPFTLFMECFQDSAKVRHIQQNPSVEILLSTPGHKHVITLSGPASIEQSPEKRTMVWNRVPESSHYFDSPEDGRMCLIRVEVTHVVLQEKRDGIHEKFETDVHMPVEHIS